MKVSVIVLAALPSFSSTGVSVQGVNDGPQGNTRTHTVTMKSTLRVKS